MKTALIGIRSLTLWDAVPSAASASVRKTNLVRLETCDAKQQLLDRLDLLKRDYECERWPMPMGPGPSTAYWFLDDLPCPVYWRMPCNIFWDLMAEVHDQSNVIIVPKMRDYSSGWTKLVNYAIRNGVSEQLGRSPMERKESHHSQNCVVDEEDDAQQHIGLRLSDHDIRDTSSSMGSRDCSDTRLDEWCHRRHDHNGHHISEQLEFLVPHHVQVLPLYPGGADYGSSQAYVWFSTTRD